MSAATGGPVRYGIVGHGWRADFYLRLARQVPERFQCVGAVTRRPDVGARLEQRWGIPTYRSVEELVAAAAPEVVVTSVPREANPEVVSSLVALDTAVLSETPPAPDADGLRRLWAAVGASDLVQVAEQHPYLPVVVALRTLIADGVLGKVTSAQVSWTHDYHATALLRILLGVAAEPARVSAVRTVGPLLEGPDRGGWPATPEVRPAAHTLAVLEMAGRSGVYDFSEGQWFNPWRRRHVIVRGSHGEVVGNEVTWSTENGMPVSAPIVRRHTGLDGNLEGADLDTLSWSGRVLYRNPYSGARLSDEEIAIGTCLERTGQWRRGVAPPPYPLADACQDHLLALAIHAAADAGGPVTTGVEPWAWAVRP
ncbi:Gfo/Idh/MocA family oxidoreductase [Micromonospora sp. PLK6-60]|uniref:Gfo/Idh/MocA family protein n=1 Tax=Micromonospora sp. PLK6-60 TaxID=2873383 RepID=UPI001CA7889A|nr:Gfo/Idh/MocA family oxidoreductase [Micromonospora sp. PLK6-60]MBY8875534.1 Gfo/Idh/MocA family oxidoreductase [Micromonospora sp. PLK6-60]